MTALHYPEELPVSAERERIIDAVRTNRVVVIAGETGSGKTTQLPKMCLEAVGDAGGMIGCTQPRRIAAVSVAARVREELGVQGNIVGSKVRFHDRTDKKTRIKFMTDGVLLAESRRDRLLRRYRVIIIDEAHERSLNIDFLLGFLRRLIDRRPELKLLITSATIDTGAFSRHFDDAPVITVTGRTWPVKIEYHPLEEGSRETEGGVDHCVSTVQQLLRRRPDGDILIFLPTERDIRECCALLESRHPDISVLPLFGRLSTAGQSRIFRSSGRLRIIVATNVAETSITVPGIRVVIDSGTARISQYNVRAKTTSLPISRISQASADQRAGRAGRLGPGTCLRLYSEENYQNRAEFTVPEIKRSNLAEVILQMTSLKLGEPEEFPFIDPPHTSAIREGYRLLRELGAISAGGALTKRGRIMADLPIDPCISRVLLEAKELGCLREATIISAVLAIQDPRIRPAEEEQAADQSHRIFVDQRSDFLTLYNIWEACYPNDTKGSRNSLKKFCSSHYLSFQRMREWYDLRQQLVRILSFRDGFELNTTAADYQSIHRSLLAGFLRNIGMKKREPQTDSKNSHSLKKRSRQRRIQAYTGGQNKELAIFPGSALAKKPPEWLLAASFVETSRLYALTVAEVDPRWIEAAAGHLCRISWSSPHWEKRSGQVRASERVSLFGLLLSADRSVNFPRRNRRNIPEAREIFIRQGLVPGELNGRYPFLEKNLQLLERWEKSEAKLRTRSLVADDETLFQFYDRRLPEDVYDQRQLNRWLKKENGGTLLIMTDEDILQRSFTEKELHDFPETRRIGGLDLHLDYSFSPGSDDDGVTFRLPLQFAINADSRPFDWLVPGLLEEKLTWYLKSLVKSLRRRLVPVQQSVEMILDEIEFGRGDLLAAVEAAILKQHRMTVHRSDWGSELPAHLCPRFLLFADDNSTVAVSRNLKEATATAAEWQSRQSQKSRSAAQSSSCADEERRQRTRWSDREYRSWQFDGLPAQVPCHTATGEISGFLYPALKAEKQKGYVTISFEREKQQAAIVNRTGLLTLFGYHFAAQLKALKRLVSTALSGPSTLFLSPLNRAKSELAERVLMQLLHNLYGDIDGLVPTKEVFTRRLTEIETAGFFKSGQLLLDQFTAALHKRREVAARLPELFQRAKRKGSPLPETMENIFARELQQIFPAELLLSRQRVDYLFIHRQLQYLLIRLERFYANPLKDEQKAKQTEEYINRLDHPTAHQPPSSEAGEALRLYKELLAEFKISIFAPELKTRMPVSAKKLNEQWQEFLRRQ